MKKIYKNPEIHVVKVSTMEILTGSPGYGGNTTLTSGNLSRRSSWSDDEDED